MFSLWSATSSSSSSTFSCSIARPLIFVSRRASQFSMKSSQHQQPACNLRFSFSFPIIIIIYAFRSFFSLIDSATSIASHRRAWNSLIFVLAMRRRTRQFKGNRTNTMLLCLRRCAYVYHLCLIIAIIGDAQPPGNDGKKPRQRPT